MSDFNPQNTAPEALPETEKNSAKANAATGGDTETGEDTETAPEFKSGVLRSRNAQKLEDPRFPRGVSVSFKTQASTGKWTTATGTVEEEQPDAYGKWWYRLSGADVPKKKEWFAEKELKWL